MSLAIQPFSVPLSADADEKVLVGGTRVTLDTVMAAFDRGATAEEIVHQYPSLALEDVYTVLGYALRHRREVDKYLAQRQEFAQKVRAQNEARFDPAGIRERLLSRRSPDRAVDPD
jgi:uncharacterized protein (DUF433 family)